MLPRWLVPLAVVTPLLLATLAGAAEAVPSIRLSPGDPTKPQAAFEVVGLASADAAKLAALRGEPGAWSALFAVFVETDPPLKDRPAVLGAYRIEGDVLRFEPRFPLVPGLRYQAVFDPSRLPGRQPGQGKPIVASFALPKPRASATTIVQHVYPTRKVLPENQLKFYLHFSAPMSRGEAYEHIRLLTAAGKEVELAFLEVGEELWDPRGQRFTLFFDPGRIKRGLKPREDLGPAIEEGKSYTLVIDRQWEDARGNRLKDSFRKSFQVGPPDDAPIDPKKWRVETPAAGDNRPLTVRFPESLDHALLHRLLWLEDGKGERVAGTAQVTDEETRWQFVPERSWQPGDYRLVVDTTLEDLAGNKVGRPFEVDVFRPIQREVQARTVPIPFRIR